MIIAVVALIGLAMGSFIDALLFRVYASETGLAKKPQKRAKRKASERDLSMLHGRSMCESCHTQLQPRDLIPVVSWLSTRGRCRYCAKSIGIQAPALELAMAVLFVVLYTQLPVEGHTELHAFFKRAVWLVYAVGLTAMALYDARHMILPNKILFPLISLAVVQVAVEALLFDGGPERVRDAVLGLLVGGGIFYALFSVSKGRWIGGGDVKLGFFLGLVLGPVAATVALWVACLTALAVILPLMALRRISRKQAIPFGPFLIAATLFSALFGLRIANWYNDTFLLGYF